MTARPHSGRRPCSNSSTQNRESPHQPRRRSRLHARSTPCREGPSCSQHHHKSRPTPPPISRPTNPREEVYLRVNALHIQRPPSAWLFPSLCLQHLSLSLLLCDVLHTYVPLLSICSSINEREGWYWLPPAGFCQSPHVTCHYFAACVLQVVSQNTPSDATHTHGTCLLQGPFDDKIHSCVAFGPYPPLSWSKSPSLLVVFLRRRRKSLVMKGGSTLKPLGSSIVSCWTNADGERERERERERRYPTRCEPNAQANHTRACGVHLKAVANGALTRARKVSRCSATQVADRALSGFFVFRTSRPLSHPLFKIGAETCPHSVLCLAPPFSLFSSSLAARANGRDSLVLPTKKASPAGALYERCGGLTYLSVHSYGTPWLKKHHDDVTGAR